MFAIWIFSFCLILLVYRYDFFHRFSKQIYNKFKSKDFEVEAKDDCLFIANEAALSAFNWKTLIDIYDTGKIFLIFVSNEVVILIPKRAFESKEKSCEFFNFINEKLKN